MGFAGATRLDGDRIATQLGTDPSALSPAAARSVATTLVADGVFSEPYCEWMPLWYELALFVPVRYADWRLGRVARTVAKAADVSVSAPRFSRPRDVVVDGHRPLVTVSGFRDRFLLAAALLHLEWFVHVAAADGIDVPPSLVARTRAESLSYYAGDSEALSPRVARFQAALFGDDAWVRRINDVYELDSWLFGLWERLLRAERRRLELVQGL
jgi:hypothetical protein